MRERNVNKIYNIYKNYTAFEFIHRMIVKNLITSLQTGYNEYVFNALHRNSWNSVQGRILNFPHFLPVQTPITNKEYIPPVKIEYTKLWDHKPEIYFGNATEKRQSTWYEKSKHMYICLTPKNKDCNNVIIATDFATLLRWFKVSITHRKSFLSDYCSCRTAWRWFASFMNGFSVGWWLLGLFWFSGPFISYFPFYDQPGLTCHRSSSYFITLLLIE